MRVKVYLLQKLTKNDLGKKLKNPTKSVLMERAPVENGLLEVSDLLRIFTLERRKIVFG